MMTEERYPARGAFPTTRRSAVTGARSGDAAVRRAAYDTLIAAYWAPVCTYLRFRHAADPDGAKDLAQGFFAHALERGQLERYDATRASFRTYLRTCLDSYVANVRRAAGAERRGGRFESVPLDGAAEAAHASPEADPDALFPISRARSICR
jgi:DNA-directed RNA polymerase specialized sigma24 family protein